MLKVRKKAKKSNKKNKPLNFPKKKKSSLSDRANSPSGSFQQSTLQKALTFHQTGNASQAEALYRQILNLRPNDPQVLYCLGVLYRQKGMDEKAVLFFNKAIANRPNFIEAYKILTDILLAQGKKDDAVATYRQLLSLQPDDADNNNNFGVLLYNLGMLDEALIYFRKSVLINPEDAIAYHNIGNVLRELGFLDNAILNYKKALSLKPDYVEAFRVLSLMQKHTEVNDDIIFYENMYTNGNLVEENKMHLGFSLGKIYEDLKDYDKAFSFIHDANRIKRKSYKYSIKTDYDFFERIKNTFSHSFFNSHIGLGYYDHSPIFIVGMPRSGSTLIEQIISSHPLVFSLGEVSIISNIIYENSLMSREHSIPEFLSDINNDIFYKMGEDYIEKARAYSGDAQYITDKHLYNFLTIGFIKTILPNAKIIHSARNPMDNCLSIFKNYFTNTTTCKFAYDLTELGQYYCLYRSLMEHWEKVFPGFIYTVKYEELTSDTENQISKLLTFCGLSLDEGCFSFYKKEGMVRTTSFMQVRQPIYRDSVESWRRYEKQLEPLRKALELSFNGFSPPESPPISPLPRAA